MGSQEARPEAIDLSHHLNTTSKSRHPSPLKDIIQYMAYDGMISLAGGACVLPYRRAASANSSGLPHPSLFPLQSATFTCLAPTSPIGDGEKDLVSLSLERAASAQTLDLVPFLQYGLWSPVPASPPSHSPPSAVSGTFWMFWMLTRNPDTGTGAGNRELLAIARDLTDRVHKPLYRYDCLLHPGNTNAWAKVVGLLCEQGDSILVEEFTYPSAQAFWIPLGMKGVPVRADAEGMTAEHLDRILSDWDDTKGRRPHVYVL